MSTEREREARDHRSRGRLRDRSRCHRQTVIEANAYREAEQIRGEGDAIAAEVCTNAFNQDQEFYSFYRSILRTRVRSLGKKICWSSILSPFSAT